MWRLYGSMSESFFIIPWMSIIARNKTRIISNWIILHFASVTLPLSYSLWCYICGQRQSTSEGYTQVISEGWLPLKRAKLR